MFILLILANSEDFLAFLRTYLRILRNRSVNSQFSIHKYFVLTGKVSVSKCGKLCKPWKWPVFCYRIWFIVAYMEERKRGTFFCSFGNILEVLYLYFILSREMAWMPFLTASDMEVTLPWRVILQKISCIDNRTSYMRTSE